MLYKAESMVFDRIANANINCDERPVLSFEQRPDGKYKRPLEYPIRLCFPLNDRAEGNMWRRVPLVRDNRLAQRAVMLPMKNRIMVEYLDDECPPDSCAADLDVNPVIATANLEIPPRRVSLMAPPGPSNLQKNAMLVIDVGPKTGDWARSVLRMLATMNAPVYYCSIFPPEEVQNSAKALAQYKFF